MTKQKSPLEVEIYPALPTLTIAYLAAGPTPTRPSTLQRLSAHSKLRIRIAQLGITSPVLHSRLCSFFISSAEAAAAATATGYQSSALAARAVTHRLVVRLHTPA